MRGQTRLSECETCLTEINSSRGVMQLREKVIDMSGEHLMIHDASEYENHFNKRGMVVAHCVVSGTVRFTIDDVDQVCDQGSFILIPLPAAVLQKTISLAPAEVCTIIFETSREWVQPEVIERVSPALKQPWLLQACSLGRALKEVLSWREVSDENAHTTESIRRLFAEHVATLAGQLEKIPARKRATQIELYNRVHRARHYIMQNLHAKITLDEMARVAGLSKYHFSRCFIVVYGISPCKFLLEARLLASVDMIRSNRTQLTEVSCALQFSDFAYFSNQFKSRFGVRPSRLLSSDDVKSSRIPDYLSVENSISK